MRADKHFAEQTPTETYGSGRRCAHPGCATRLSIYNPGVFCSIHDVEPDPLEDIGEARPGYKHCAECGTLLPATVEHFQRHNATADGLRHYCRRCDAKNHSEQRRRKQPPRTEKRCTICGRVFPLTVEHWYAITGTGRFTSHCRTCAQTRARESARRKRAAERAAKEVAA